MYCTCVTTIYALNQNKINYCLRIICIISGQDFARHSTRRSYCKLGHLMFYRGLRLTVSFVLEYKWCAFSFWLTTFVFNNIIQYFPYTNLLLIHSSKLFIQYHLLTFNRYICDFMGDNGLLFLDLVCFFIV